MKSPPFSFSVGSSSGTPAEKLHVSIGFKVHKSDTNLSPGELHHVEPIDYFPGPSVIDGGQLSDSGSHLLEADSVNTIQEKIVLFALMAFLEFFPAPARAGIISPDFSHQPSFVRGQEKPVLPHRGSQERPVRHSRSSDSGHVAFTWSVGRTNQDS